VSHTACHPQAPISIDTGGGTSASVALPEVVRASDNSGTSVKVTKLVAGVLVEALHIFPVGTTEVQYKGADEAGNLGYCNMQVSVSASSVPPTISTVDWEANKVDVVCPPALTLPADPGMGFASLNVIAEPWAETRSNSKELWQAYPLDHHGAKAKAGEYTERISIGESLTQLDSPKVKISIGTHLVTHIVQLAGSQVAKTCEQRIAITDIEEPSIACPPPPAPMSCDPGQPTRTLAALPIVNAQDNSGQKMLVHAYMSSSRIQAPQHLRIGETVIEFRTEDAGGNTGSCTVVYRVEDREPPVVKCPGSPSVPNDVGKSFASYMLGAPVVTDNSASGAELSHHDGHVTIELTGAGTTLRPTGGTYDAVAAEAFLAKRQTFNIGTTTLTFTGRDPAGNTHECVSQVVVQDVEPPVLKCPPNREVSANPGQRTIKMYAVKAEATDNSGRPCVVATTVAGIAVGSEPVEFKLGANAVVHTAQDGVGNVGTCTSTITVAPPGAGAEPVTALDGVQQPVSGAKAGGTVVQHTEPPPPAVSLVAKSDTSIHTTWAKAVGPPGAVAFGVQSEYQMAEKIASASMLKWTSVTTSAKTEWRHLNMRPSTQYAFRVRSQWKVAKASAWVNGPWSNLNYIRTHERGVGHTPAAQPAQPATTPPTGGRAPAPPPGPVLGVEQLRKQREVQLSTAASISSNGGWLAFDCPLVFGGASTMTFHLWLVDDGSMQGPVIPSTEASARHVTQTARDSLNNVTPNLRVTRPKGATGSKFYLSGPRSATKRSLQGAYSTHTAGFSRWLHIGLTLKESTVSLWVDGVHEASYTVQGTRPGAPPSLSEAVLFGSGDDFNGMSAIIDGVSFYRTRALSGVELVNDQRLHAPLALPPALARPLVDTGPDLIFDEAVSMRVRQLVWHTQEPEEVPSDIAIIGHYLVAHALGCERAHLALGHRHLYGIGVPEDCALAAHYYMFASEKGIDEMIQNNINSSRDVEFRLAEGPGSVDDFLGQIDQYDGILGEDDALFKQRLALAEDRGPGAPLGDAEAQYWLAKHFYWGRAGLRKNFTATVHYNRMAVAQDHVDALQFMGILHAKGHGVEVNHDIGLEFSMRAAAKGNLAAHNTIGYYHERQGDYITALKHFKTAAEGDNSYGHYNIALLYSDGLGTLRQDNAKALLHYELAAEHGHPSCMLMMAFYFLGLTDELGDPVTKGPRAPRDCPRAMSYLTPVAEIGEWGDFRQARRKYISGRHSMPLNILECQVSTMVDSDACPHPTAGDRGELPARPAKQGGHPVEQGREGVDRGGGLIPALRYKSL
jgi:TPR repeat protein